MDRFAISATGLSINYMPQYVAEELGYFEEQGIELSSYVPDPWTICLKDMNAGRSESVLGGVWVPLVYLRNGGGYREFAKMSSRCPFALVSRKPLEKEFSWKDLEGKVVLSPGSNSIGPSVLIAGAAEEAGADDTKIRIVHDFYLDMLEELFIGGWGDYVCTKSESAAMMEMKGQGYVATYMTESAGPCPWSVYYATQETLNREDDLCGRFTLALQKGYNWLRSHDGYACREILAKRWPKVDARIGQDVVDMFLRTGMWPETCDLTHEELHRWELMLMSKNHLLPEEIPYEELVDSRPFLYAKEKLGM